MKKQNNKVMKSIKNTVDMYESRNVNIADNVYSNTAQNRYRKMLGGKDKIVPRNYRKFQDDDSDSEFSDEGSSNNSDKMSTFLSEYKRKYLPLDFLPLGYSNNNIFIHGMAFGILYFSKFKIFI